MALTNHPAGSLFNTDGLRCLYHLEDVQDSSGNGYTLTAAGWKPRVGPDPATIVSGGVYGKCGNIVRSTSNQCFHRPDRVGIEGGAITIAAWAQFSGTAAEGSLYTIAAQHDDTVSYVSYRLKYAKTGGSTYLKGSRVRNQIESVDLWAAATLPSGTWHHVVYTYDTVNQWLYIDGQLIGGPMATSGNGQTIFNDVIIIGMVDDNLLGADCWNGKIDEVLVFNRAWSTQEVYNYYHRYSSALHSGIDF